MTSKPCPICGSELTRGDPNPQDDADYDCPNCAEFRLSFEASVNLQNVKPEAKAALSHAVWLNQSRGRFHVLSSHIEAAEKEDVPTPAEQLESFILFVGDQLRKNPGGTCTHSSVDLRAKTGAVTTDDVVFIKHEVVKSGLATDQDRKPVFFGRLTMKGWQFYGELKRGKAAGHAAFIAMPFRIPEVKKVVDEVFRPAVEETGFRLKRLDDEPAAGQIDDRLRVQIRMCRFLIADLTCDNGGAYWEAGYADGLGKPVIYTCNRFYFEKEGTHFDTNHCQTVLWDLANPEQAATDLKATIRATLPFEAIMPED